MKRIILFLFTGVFVLPLYAQQVHRAWLGDFGQVQVEEVELTPEELQHLVVRDEVVYQQLANWPKKIVAHPNFKSFRGVTLADITGDGRDEILMASWNQLFVFNGEAQLVWSLTLTGTATYPPSVADVTGNGQPEIVQLTGGVPNNGRAYVISKDGNILPGWPVSINNNWLLSSPVLADLDSSGQMEIIFGVRTVNQIHVLKADGTPFNEHWPVTLSSIPAFTPSVGDINNDGQLNIIAGASNGTLYAFDLNGQNIEGFPVAAPSTSFSYQSPLLADLDGEGKLSIVGATHGDAPQYFIRNSDGSYRAGWPKAVPGNVWTYHPPTLADINGDSIFEVFHARPIGETPDAVISGHTPDGTPLSGYPIVKGGGLEGFLSVADADGDGNFDLLFGSNLMVDGFGFIHAWKADGSGQLAGFPLRPKGFTFINGANLGDVTGDGNLNLVALSYEQTFSATDSTFINVWDLGISMQQARVLFGTYKGSNTRTGLRVIEMEEPEPVFYPVTFNLDLSEVQGNFNPDLDEFFITGSMFGWAVPGTQPGIQLLERQQNTFVYSITMELLPGEYQYKYFLNQGWSGGEWEGAPDRTFTVEEEDLQLNDVWADIPGGQPFVANLILEVNPTDGGAVVGAGMYLPNAHVSVSAQPSLHFRFINWTDENDVELTTDDHYPFFMPRSHRTLTANFMFEAGIDEYLTADFRIYPNPTTGQFTIRSGSIIQSFSLTEVTGKVLYDQKVNASQVLVERPLQAGVYLVTLITNDGVFVRKLHVKN